MIKIVFQMVFAFLLPGLACVFFGYAVKWMDGIRENSILLVLVGVVALVMLYGILKSVVNGLRGIF